MAEREIEIVIKARDLASGEVEEVIRKITDIGPASGKVSKDVAGHSGLMRLGMFSAGEGVENLAGKFGITGKAGRQLGNVVEGLVGGLGTFSLVIGGASLAIGAAVMVWNRMEAVAKASREAVDKSVASLKGEVDQLYRNIPATEEYNRQLYTTLQWKRSLLLPDLKTQIRQETEEIEKQTKRLEERAGIESRYGGDVRQDFLQRMGIIPSAAGIQRELNEHKTKLADAQLELRKISRPVSFQEFTNTAQNQEALAADMTNFMYRELAIGKTGDELKLIQMDQHHAAEIAKLEEHGSNQAQIATAQNIQRLEREQLLAIQTRQLDQQTAQNRIQVMQGVGQVMGMLYDVTGRKMKAFFILQKGAAASEAYFNYKLAAAKAVGQTGIFGIGMEAYFTAMSYIVPPLIMASAFTGPGAGGGGTAATGGIPTVGGEGATGIPSGTMGTTYETHITIMNPLDGADVQRVVEQYVLPAISDAEKRSVT